MTALFDVATLGRAREAAALAGGAACVLAAGSTSRTALVVTAGPLPGGVVAHPGRAAARLRDRLRARDLGARASGRIVWCPAASAADGVRAAAVGGPVVLAVCRPRTDWVDELLAQAAHALIAGAMGEPLTALVLADLRERSLHATVVPPADGVRAALALLGLAAPAAWRSLHPLVGPAAA